MIEMTEEARQQFFAERLRLGKPALGIQISFLYGCGGAGFRVTFTDSPHSFESTIEAHGIPVYLDAQSRETLHGAVLDWEAGAEPGFILRHPDAALVDFC
jgi:Fe-S cluster assembly iron-binding protein IscA